jgi:DNA-binding MltR family transcriptional regulator
MTDTLKPPEIKLATIHDLLLITCPACQDKRATPAKSLLRGLNYICEGCGMRVQSSPNSDIPSGVIGAQRGHENLNIQVIKRPDGVWVFLDDGEKSILSTLDLDSERAIGIVIGSMIENRLQRAMLAKFHRSKQIEERLLQASGPLGSFSAKIDLACLIGLISTEAHHDLMVLKDIRNRFAHDLSILNFASQQIRDKAQNFKLLNSYVAEAEIIDGKQMFANMDPSAKPALFTTHLRVRKQEAKDRYLLTAQLLTIKFATCESPTCAWPLI